LKIYTDNYYRIL